MLDSEGLAGLLARRLPLVLEVLLRKALQERRDVLLPSVVCAEVCRGPARTAAVEAALARHDGREAVPTVRLVDTDLQLAKEVGAILHAVGAGSTDIVDAHVVAVCVPYGGGIVVTSDPGDIMRLAQAVPSSRIVVRSVR